MGKASSESRQADHPMLFARFGQRLLPLLPLLLHREPSLSNLIERITREAIACHLYTADLPDPDLIIRTSGEIACLVCCFGRAATVSSTFTDVLWPALRKVDILRAIRAYQARNRRFGR
jgi:short-chain Z-isoprenyl diphosphate synthase